MRPTETSPAALRAGDSFRPYGLFIGPLIPISLLCNQSLSPLAKLLFACLSMHLGKSGDRCNPRSSVLSAELGTSQAKIERAIKELSDAGLIRRRSNGPGRAWETEIIWHPTLEGSLRNGLDSAPVQDHQLDVDSANMQDQTVTDSAPVRIQEGVDSSDSGLDSAPVQRNDSAPVQSYLKGSVEKIQEKVKPPSGSFSSFTQDQTAEMRRLLEGYMYRQVTKGSFANRPLPDDIVAMCLEESNGAALDEVKRFLRQLHQNGQSPLDSSGPRDWAWFPVVLRNAFGGHRQQQERPAKRENLTPSESAPSRRMSDGPERPANAPRASKTQLRENVSADVERTPGLRGMSKDDFAWIGSPTLN